MNTFLKYALSAAVLTSSAALFADCDSDCTTSCESSCESSSSCGSTVACYPLRSQSRYKVRQDAGMVGHTHDVGLDKQDSYWGTFSADVGYQETFKSRKIANALLGNDFACTFTTTSACSPCDRKGSTILIQGSTVAGRSPSAWLADYFYLPTDFNGSFSIRPKIQTVFADLNLYIGLDEWWKGTYVQLYGPIAYTRWDLGFSEQTPISSGTADHPVGYFTPNSLSRTNLVADFSAYIKGQTVRPDGLIRQIDNPGIVHTVIFQPLNYARMSCGSRKETGFADLRAEFGWNFWQDQDYHVGINIQGAAPTGNQCCSRYLFDAVVGNGKHWELGGGLTAHYLFNRSEDNERHCGIYADLNITHIFSRSGLHTYDLKGLPNSKYMLAAKFGPNSQLVRGIADDGPIASRQFAEEYAPVANLTTVNVDVSSGVQIDLVTKLNYTRAGFSWDIGYNFYFRSCQDVDCASECESCDNSIANLCSAEKNSWALKGDARMYGFAIRSETAFGDGQAIPLSATNNQATIHGGTNIPAASTFGAHVNGNIDNPQLSYVGDTATASVLHQLPTNSIQINTSIQPIFLRCSDINMSGTESMSHGLFTHLQYNFKGENITPYFGIGAMAEFGSNANDCCESDCSDDCITATASSWQVWLKGGVSFN